jgi:hypothetical protein
MVSKSYGGREVTQRLSVLACHWTAGRMGRPKKTNAWNSFVTGRYERIGRRSTCMPLGTGALNNLFLGSLPVKFLKTLTWIGVVFDTEGSTALVQGYGISSLNTLIQVKRSL